MRNSIRSYFPTVVERQVTLPQVGIEEVELPGVIERRTTDHGGEVDGRGSRGVRGERPSFNWVKLKIRLHSNETPERLERLKKNVEYRCPVMNLFREADVDVEADWKLVPE